MISWQSLEPFVRLATVTALIFAALQFRLLRGSGGSKWIVIPVAVVVEVVGAIAICIAPWPVPHFPLERLGLSGDQSLTFQATMFVASVITLIVYAKRSDV